MDGWMDGPQIVIATPWQCRVARFATRFDLS